MTKEEKQLLLKDISARIPYGIKCFTKYGALPIFQMYYDGSIIFEIKSPDGNGVTKFGSDIPLPYLRPMSSMTEKEVSEFESITDKFLEDGISEEIWNTVIDWLNAHYFDHRHLIERGLALEAPENMY